MISPSEVGTSCQQHVLPHGRATAPFSPSSPARALHSRDRFDPAISIPTPSAQSRASTSRPPHDKDVRLLSTRPSGSLVLRQVVVARTPGAVLAVFERRAA